MTKSILLHKTSRIEAAEGNRRAQHLRALRVTSAPTTREGKGGAEITVRALHDEDRAAMGRLAGRDSAAIPAGHTLGAEVDGSLVAILSLADGSVIADPFHSTSSAVELLRLRASQLGRGGVRRTRLPRMRRRGRVPRARGALAGSPPGSSRLLQL